MMNMEFHVHSWSTCYFTFWCIWTSKHIYRTHMEYCFIFCHMTQLFISLFDWRPLQELFSHHSCFPSFLHKYFEFAGIHCMSLFPPLCSLMALWAFIMTAKWTISILSFQKQRPVLPPCQDVNTNIPHNGQLWPRGVEKWSHFSPSVVDRNIQWDIMMNKCASEIVIKKNCNNKLTQTQSYFIPLEADESP